MTERRDLGAAQAAALMEKRWTRQMSKNEC